MADAAETMRYLMSAIDIAPAGTREEGEAAVSLSEVFHEHGLQTANKTFSYSTLGKVPYALCAAVMGIAGIIGALTSNAAAIVMFILALIVGVLCALDEFFNVKTVSRIGMSGSSQNIVARHPASTTVNGQKARPVVIIAHYDTPRGDILSIPAISWIKPYLRPTVMICMAVEVVALFIKILPVPTVLYSIMAALVLVASIILILWAITVLLQRFVMPFTVGANDNKASVAALFGLLDRVRPQPASPGSGPNEVLFEAMEERDDVSSDDDMSDADDAGSSRRYRGGSRTSYGESGYSRPSERPWHQEHKTNTVRYGADVVMSLDMLPESCEVEYVWGSAVPVAREDEAEPAVHRASDNAEIEANQFVVVEGATIMMPSPASSAEAAAAEEAVADEVAAGEAVAEEAALEEDVDEIAEEAAADVAAAEEAVAEEIGEAEESLEAAAEAAAAEQADPEAHKDAEADAIVADIVNATIDTEKTSLMEPVDAINAQAAAQPFRVLTSSDEPDAELQNNAGNVPPDVAAQAHEASESFFSDDPSQITDDPTWGTTSFVPVVTGRRVLGDIPDPAVAAIDPFSVTSVDVVGSYNPDDFSEIDFETGTHQAVTPAMVDYERRMALDGFTDEIAAPAKRGRKSKKNRQGRISEQGARMQAEMEEESFNDWLGLDETYNAQTNGQQIGTWDNFNDSQDPQNGQGNNQPWQGGAAPSSSRREAGESTPSETRRAAMSLGDRELVAHDIWFVLTGASEADHAGVEDFLQSYRADLRGAYFINLECVGAGRQSLILEEGAGRHVKADRRLVNLFGDASVAINRPLALARMGWRDTGSTPVLRQGCRAVTVSGMSKGVPTYARWTGDTPERVDVEMIDDIVDVLVEVIKNA